MIFTGHHEHAIDAKNRLAIPAKFRSRIDPERDGKGLYVVPGVPLSTLWIYTERYFEALVERRVSSSLIPDEDVLRFEQEYFPRAELLELDSQGRILIPDKMLKDARLERDVVICGVRDHLEIRRRDEFENEYAAGWDRYREYQLKARQAYNAFQRRVGEEPGAT